MNRDREKTISRLNEILQPLELSDRLGLIATQFPHAVFTTSLGPEDQLITCAVAQSAARIRIVTLQTGRLFRETEDLLRRTKQHYAIAIDEVLPRADDVAAYVDRHGENGFYDSVDARHACCRIRKIEPLKRALAGADAWITGLRRDQSGDRARVPLVEWATDHVLMKFNPLADWSREQMLVAIAESHVPTNPLHARGYPSIGCEPCTRAIRPGEPERAGRWWWESEQKRECGLHLEEPRP